MNYVVLGDTGISVSQLCFGSLTIGPLQRKLEVKDGAKILLRAFELGVNFVDTAQLYGTYPYIKRALAEWSGEVIVASKSYAYTREDMENAVREALVETGLSRIGLFLLHETESEHTIRGHWPALEYLLYAKQEGIVGAVGISTHHLAAVRAAANIPEIDVISPLINERGLGIADGARDGMLSAIATAHANNKGIYAMKPLGGGHLSSDSEKSLRWILDQECIDSVAIGMKTIPEVEYNTAYFSGKAISAEVKSAVSGSKRQLHIEDWCTGCARCVEKCASQALRIDNDHAVSDPGKCVFCGYCGAICPQFAIKVI